MDCVARNGEADMVNKPITKKMSAGDILSSEAVPGASTVTGQHMMLNNKTAIDPGAEARVIQAEGFITVASGTTLYIL